MIEPVSITSRRDEPFFFGAPGFRRLRRIFLAIFLEKLLLHRLRKSRDRIARLFPRRIEFEHHRAVINLDNPVAANEAVYPEIPAVLIHLAIGKVDAETDVEGRMLVRLRIIKEAEQQVGNVAPILPETEPARGEHARRAFGIGNEMHTGEEMDEEIAADPCAVIPVVAPAEEAQRVERHFRRAAQEAFPVYRLRRSIRRNSVLPRA